jgi:hypothetical protein
LCREPYAVFVPDDQQISTESPKRPVTQVAIPQPFRYHLQMCPEENSGPSTAPRFLGVRASAGNVKDIACAASASAKGGLAKAVGDEE